MSSAPVRVLQLNEDERPISETPHTHAWNLTRDGQTGMTTQHSGHDQSIAWILRYRLHEIQEEVVELQIRMTQRASKQLPSDYFQLILFAGVFDVLIDGPRCFPAHLEKSLSSTKPRLNDDHGHERYSTHESSRSPSLVQASLLRSDFFFPRGFDATGTCGCTMGTMLRRGLYALRRQQRQHSQCSMDDAAPRFLPFEYNTRVSLLSIKSTDDNLCRFLSFLREQHRHRRRVFLRRRLSCHCKHE